MSRYRITVAYDGTDYAGWQVQPNGVTVQATIERALRELTGEQPKVHGSGRTDQGVHARGQVAHFDLAASWEPDRLLRALNATLPEDIRVMKAGRAAAAFHARRDAVSKEYRYFIWNGGIMPPDLRRYCVRIRRPLDTAAMRRGAAHLVGRHDFAAFAANPNRAVESTVRSLTELRLLKKGRSIVLAARGEGFLYRMVRSIAGLLIRVGEGAVQADDVPRILESRERTARVPTAPPQGLFLWQVRF